MALIVRDVGLLFIMAPHTGCTSIGKVLRRKLDAKWLPESAIHDAKGLITVPRKHTTLAELLHAGLLSAGERSEFVVAAGVRNPFDEQVSFYLRRHRARRPRLREERRRSLIGVPLKPRALGEIKFETWLRRRYVGRPWSRLLGHEPKRPQDWTEGVDFVIRFEHIRDDFAEMLTRVGVTSEIRVPHRNRTKPRESRPYQEFYTPRGRAIVEDVFGERIERHGYTFDAPATSES